jgi:double-stranded uracil-DNA glycosylase
MLPDPLLANRPMTELAGIHDVLGPSVRLLLVGINPGIRSSQTGHHFAHPANRFWPALFAAGITPRLYTPAEQHLLPRLGIGITNLAARPSATAAEVTAAELRAGAQRLERLTAEHRPRVVAVLGLTAYRTAFSRRTATAGPQPEPLGPAQLWVLPNPSGLNAHSKPADHAAGVRAAALAAGIPLDTNPPAP